MGRQGRTLTKIERMDLCELRAKMKTDEPKAIHLMELVRDRIGSKLTDKTIKDFYRTVALIQSAKTEGGKRLNEKEFFDAICSIAGSHSFDNESEVYYVHAEEENGSAVVSISVGTVTPIINPEPISIDSENNRIFSNPLYAISNEFGEVKKIYRNNAFIFAAQKDALVFANLYWVYLLAVKGKNMYSGIDNTYLRRK